MHQVGADHGKGKVSSISENRSLVLFSSVPNTSNLSGKDFYLRKTVMYSVSMKPATCAPYPRYHYILLFASLSSSAIVAFIPELAEVLAW